MLLLPQGFNLVPGKSPDKAVAASAASEVGTFHLSGPPNRRNPRETRTAAIPLLCQTGRETRKPGRILNPRNFHLHTALSITCNLTRVNRNTQARDKSLPTCTNTPAWDPCWVFWGGFPPCLGVSRGSDGQPKEMPFPARTPARQLSGSAERKSTITQSGAAAALQPMSGGQNHKGIERLNIFLGAGCRDELGKGVRLGFFDPVAFLEILHPSWGNASRG